MNTRHISHCHWLWTHTLYISCHFDLLGLLDMALTFRIHYQRLLRHHYRGTCRHHNSLQTNMQASLQTQYLQINLLMLSLSVFSICMKWLQSDVCNTKYFCHSGWRGSSWLVRLVIDFCLLLSQWTCLNNQLGACLVKQARLATVPLALPSLQCVQVWLLAMPEGPLASPWCYRHSPAAGPSSGVHDLQTTGIHFYIHVCIIMNYSFVEWS